MYHLLLPAIQALLSATGSFGAVVCGTGSGLYPLANVILRKSIPAKGGPTEEAHVLVQIQSAAGDDSEEAYLATLQLLQTARDALHGIQLPGHGARRLQVDGVETAQVKDTGEMIYYLPVRVIVDPAQFTTT